jgi:NADP-dependent alcohol dehydrogenase
MRLTAFVRNRSRKNFGVIAPSLYRVMFETKGDKLAQYGERVFNITGMKQKEKPKIEKNSQIFFPQWEWKPNFQKTENYKDTADFIVNRFTKEDGRSW